MKASETKVDILTSATPESMGAACLIWLLTEGCRLDRSSKRRQYYISHRQQILAANRASRLRRGHLWIQKYPKWGRVRCGDCGLTVPFNESRGYFLHKKCKFTRCRVCASEMKNGRPLERVEHLVNITYQHMTVERQRVLEEEHLFRYAPTVALKAEAESDDDHFVLDLQMTATQQAFDTLTPRSQLVVIAHLRGRSFGSISKHLKVSRNRIAQIFNASVKLLQRRIRAVLVLKLPEEQLPPLRY